MANMAYCRFQNTEIDLQDCLDNLNERNIESEEEKQAAKDLFINFLEYCEEEGIISDFNRNRIDNLIAECKDQENDGR